MLDTAAAREEWAGLERQMREAVEKLGPEGVERTIEVSAVRRDGFVAISVRDTGRGIPHEYLDRIFEPFVQAPNAAAGGAGLGLSISRRIVEAHGGQLVVRSQVGQGTTFTFTMPVAARGAA